MKKWWILLVILCVALTIPSVFQKHRIETSSQQVELAVNFAGVLDVSNHTENPQKTTKKILKKLQKMNVTSITVPFNTFYSLEKRGIVAVMSGKDVKAKQFGSTASFPVNTDAQYVLVLDNQYKKDMSYIMNHYFKKKDVKAFTSADTSYYEVDTSSEDLYKKRFKPLTQDVRTIQSYGFNLISMVPNVSKENVPTVVNQLKQWQKKGVLSKVMFDGTEVLGYPTHFDKYQSLWSKYTVVYQESFSPETKQKGMQTVLEDSNYQGVRAHVLPGAELALDKNTVPVLEERLVKAIHERNMRMLYFGIPVGSVDDPTEYVDKLQDVIQATTKNLTQKGYTIGEAHPFLSHHFAWVSVAKVSFAVLTGVIFALLLSLYVPIRYAVMGWIASYVLMTGVYVLSPHALWVINSFVFAVMVPILLGGFIIQTYEQKTLSFGKNIAVFMVASLISLLSALTLTSTFADVRFILYVEQFRGVALAHVLPILAVAFLLIFLKGNNVLLTLWNVTQKPLKIYHVLIGIVGLGLIYYYVSRTGNGGTMLPFESQFRSLLQDSFGIRPRTKEFLFAHPLLIVCLIYWKRHRLVKWILPVAIIGQISIVNTFTHLHTPVLVSFERALIGIGLGVIIGLIFVAVIHFGEKGIRKLLTRLKIDVSSK